jgi:uncharacterized damage-inducible protein DinB
MCAGLVQTHRAFAYNNAWASHRLLGACAELTQGEFEAERTGFFPSLQATLNHIYGIDLFFTLMHLRADGLDRRPGKIQFRFQLLQGFRGLKRRWTSV